MDLVGAQEIARMFGGISRQRVHEITTRADFPAPLADLAQGRIWDREVILIWAKERGRPVVGE